MNLPIYFIVFHLTIKPNFFYSQKCKYLKNFLNQSGLVRLTKPCPNAILILSPYNGIEGQGVNKEGLIVIYLKEGCYEQKRKNNGKGLLFHRNCLYGGYACLGCAVAEYNCWVAEELSVNSYQ